MKVRSKAILVLLNFLALQQANAASESKLKLDEVKMVRPTPNEMLKSVAFASNGSSIATLGGSGTLAIWDGTNGRQKGQIERKAFQELPSKVEWLSDGRWLALGYPSGEVQLLDSSNPSSVKSFSKHDKTVRVIVSSPDEKLIASGANDTKVKIWERSSGRCMGTLEGHDEAVISLAFSASNKWLVSGSWDTKVRIWEVDSGRVLSTLSDHSAWVNAVAFSPDDSVIAAGAEDGSIRVWDVSSGTLLQTMKVPSGNVEAIAFSPDGRYLASGGEDKKVHLWHVERGTLTLQLPTLSTIKFLSFSAKGDLLAGERSGILNAWRIQGGLGVAIKPAQKAQTATQEDCVVCVERPRSHVASACGHRHVCGECAKKLTQCPDCRRPTTWTPCYL